MPFWIIQIVVGVVLMVASTLLRQAQQQPQQQSASGISSSYTTGGTNPLSFVVGTLGLKGQLEYENTWGNDGDTPNAYLTQVFSLSDLPATALVGLFADGERQTLPGTGHVAQGYPVTGSRGGNVWYEFHDGTQTTASSFLTATFGSDADRPWLSDMVGRGIAYVTATALYDREVWSGFPSYVFEIQGLKLYDPRQDTTAGGSGSQRRDDSSTWAFSDNPAVIIYNILIGIRFGGKWVWGAQEDVDPARLPYDVWAAAMDACDEDVTLSGGGTEKRFRVGRSIEVSEKPADVIAELLTACNGRISEAAGVYSIVVGAPGDAVGSFSDADVIVTEGASLEPFPSLDEIVNGATGTYLEPAEAWQEKEAVPYYRSDLELEDDGRRQAADVKLVSVFSGTQAQRVLKATVEDGRRFYRHVLVLPPQFGLYTPLDVLAFTSARNGYTSKPFLVTSTEEGPDCKVVVGLQEIDASDHDWSTDDEQDFDFAPLTPVRPPAQVMTGLSASPANFYDNAGNARKPGIAVTWPTGLADVRAVLVTVREKNAAGIEWSGEMDYAANPGGGTIPHAFIGATDYQVQADYIPYSARAHTPSSWLNVTTDDIPVDVVDFGPRIRSLVKYFNTKLADLDASIGQIGAILDANDLSSYQDKQVFRQQVISQVGSAMAIAGQLFSAASSEIAAEAEARTAAIASLGSAFAGGIFEIDGSVSGSGAGATATIAGKIKVQDGDAFGQGGFIWRATSDGAGNVTVEGMLQQDTLYLVDSDGNVTTAITFDLTTGKIIGASLSLGGGTVNIDDTGITIGSHVSISATGAVTFSA